MNLKAPVPLSEPSASNANKKYQVSVYISNEAKAYLVERATELQYISPYAKTYGFGNYIAALSRATFTDTRPPDVRELDITLLTADRLPLWSMELQRYRMTFVTTPDAMQHLKEAAITLGITNTRRGDSVELPYSPTSMLLEAIGIGWVTPTDVPHCQHPPKGHKKRKEPTTWI